MNTCQTSIKYRYIIMVPSSPSLVEVRDTTVGSQRTDLSVQVILTNTDLPNTYSRSTTETIMYPVGQDIPTNLSAFRNCNQQPPPFLNSEHSKDARRASFLTIFLSLYGTLFRLPTGKMHFITTRSVSISFLPSSQTQNIPEKLSTLMTSYRSFLIRAERILI